jgi:hypothetical protein
MRRIRELNNKLRDSTKLVVKNFPDASFSERRSGLKDRRSGIADRRKKFKVGE